MHPEAARSGAAEPLAVRAAIPREAVREAFQECPRDNPIPPTGGGRAVSVQVRAMSGSRGERVTICVKGAEALQLVQFLLPSVNAARPYRQRLMTGHESKPPTQNGAAHSATTCIGGVRSRVSAPLPTPHLDFTAYPERGFA